MAIVPKVNPFSKSNPDTGFGVEANRLGGRFVNKDGSFNLRKDGLSLLKRLSIYSYLMDLSALAFLGIILAFFIAINTLFTSLYVLAGLDELQGYITSTEWGKIKETFFFSTETFTTVGYGRINPIGEFAHVVSAIESLAGWLSFALVTGLLYGRFTRPKAYLAFSENALIGPYKGGLGLMFRMVPYKINHHLTDARVVVNIAFMEMEDDKQQFKFYQLNLERSRIDTLNMNWTVVHPIDEESPLLNFNEEDMHRSDLELYVQVTGFDHIFSNMVMQRTSYTYKEVIWGAKFKPMYHESPDGKTTVLELDKLNEMEAVELPAIPGIS
ncbi:ion channel [Segetibacter aerophilus]|uniref:Inward rectifier potassium channel Irk n=1 Tax=Segetibacter aerophilus TaxID=670293 RepID=A0A512BHC0_9BACT|nr:ion channel [Segetibacter aerophilus]GEO11275.1 inward rectifier potassium channel Irk [Segetibacter aerophilus]